MDTSRTVIGEEDGEAKRLAKRLVDGSAIELWQKPAWSRISNRKRKSCHRNFYKPVHTSRRFERLYR